MVETVQRRGNEADSGRENEKKEMGGKADSVKGKTIWVNATNMVEG